MDNISQKSNYQLEWIVANKRMYSESQLDIAARELGKRKKIETVKNVFKYLWYSIYRFFK